MILAIVYNTLVNFTLAKFVEWIPNKIFCQFETLHQSDLTCFEVENPVSLEKNQTWNKYNFQDNNEYTY